MIAAHWAPCKASAVLEVVLACWHDDGDHVIALVFESACKAEAGV